MTTLRVALAVFLVAGATGTMRSEQSPPQAAPPSTLQEVDAVLAQAAQLVESRKISDARAAFERALEAARRLALEPQQATALCGIADGFLQSAQYRDAREFGLRCLEVYERLALPRGIGRANLILNAAAETSGDYAEARLRADRAVAAFESAGDLSGRGLATLNLLRLNVIKPAEAFALVTRVVLDARATGDRTLEASALHAWGDGLFALGNYEEAFEKLSGAAAIYEEIGASAPLGTVLNSLGRVYRAHGQLEEALRFQLKALDLHEHAGGPLLLMQSLNAVSAVYGMLGQVSQARGYLERALTIAEESSSPRIRDFLRANLASFLLQEGQSVRAADMLEAVIAGGTDTFPSQRQTLLARARLKMGQTREALAAAERAVALCGDRPGDCVLALNGRAQAQAALGNNAAALADIDTALSTLEVLRAKLVPADFFKQEFHRAQEFVYSRAIGLKLQQNQNEGALEAAELARSRAFLDLLATRDLPVRDRPKESPLVLRGPERGSGRADDLRSLAMAPPASAADIIASAARLHSTFLLYWVADDEIVAWVVTPDGRTRVQRVGVERAKLAELIRSTSPFPEPNVATKPAPAAPVLATRGAGQMELQQLQTTAWRQLYDLLVRPVRDALPSTPGALVTIVPHGPLLGLSFAALRDPRGRYLLEDYTIHYAPAAAVLQQTAARTHPDARAGNILVVADPALPSLSRLDRPLPRLPGARAEAEAIGRLLPRDRVTVLRDALATEASVRAAAAGKAVLHLATHAIVRDDDPFGSFLALGPVGGGADGDGLLTAQEIYGWDLHADLVVLSACRSGGGRVTGDGVATFARAFIYAGTPSLVASLWDVADEPTNRLLPGFYRAWLGGQSKARALRTAQLQLLRDLRAGKIQLQTPAGLVTLPEHPAFWAGFVLIGEPE